MLVFVHSDAILAAILKIKGLLSFLRKLLHNLYIVHICLTFCERISLVWLFLNSITSRKVIQNDCRTPSWIWRSPSQIPAGYQNFSLSLIHYLSKNIWHYLQSLKLPREEFLYRLLPHYFCLFILYVATLQHVSVETLYNSIQSMFVLNVNEMFSSTV